MPSKRRPRHGTLTIPDGRIAALGLVWERRRGDKVVDYRYEGRWTTRPVFGTEAALLLDNVTEVRVVVEGRTFVPVE